MQLIQLENVFSTFPNIIVCFIKHRKCCQLRTWECGKRMEEQAVDNYNEPAQKSGSDKTNSNKGWRGYKWDLLEGFHVLEQKARRGEHKATRSDTEA